MALIDFKHVGTKSDAKNNNLPQKPAPIGFKTPLRFGNSADGIFEMNFTVERQIRDNLKNLLLTNYGERLGLYYYGGNLEPLLFEFNSPDFDSMVASNIQKAVSTFMPYIQLGTLELFDASMTTLPKDADVKIKIVYSSEDYGVINDGLELYMRIAG